MKPMKIYFRLGSFELNMGSDKPMQGVIVIVEGKLLTVEADHQSELKGKVPNWNRCAFAEINGKASWVEIDQDVSTLEQRALILREILRDEKVLGREAVEDKIFSGHYEPILPFVHHPASDELWVPEWVTKAMISCVA